MRSVPAVPRHPPGWWVCWWANVPMCALLGVLARTREIPRFWRTEGGFAPWQRELVLLGFPAILGFELLYVWGLTMAMTRFRASGRPISRWATGLLVLQWVCVLGILVFQGWDNMENLLAGRPLHWGGR